MRVPGHIPWWRSLRFQLALWIALSFLGMSLAVDLVERHYDDLLYPEWYDAEFLRGRARAIERAEAGELSWEEVYEEYPATYGAVLYPQMLAIGLLLSGAVAGGVALLGTRRLNRLHRQLRAPVEQDAGAVERLPGPFEVRGRDEIAALGAALNGMRERVFELLHTLEERDRWRREWIAQVAHDLRTPLAALRAALERAEGRGGSDPRAGGDESKRRAEALAVARLDVERLDELCEDLLESARLDREEGIRTEPVPVGELLRSAVRELRELARARGVELALCLPRGLPVLEADGARLTRALENLLRNALQHGARHIRVSAHHEGSELSIEVRDDGEGLDLPGPDPLPLSVLLQQLRHRGSLGIGLQVVERILHLHGAQATVHPLPSGTLFRLTLPLPPPAPARDSGAGASTN